ncbi:MAG: nucleoside-diphosphate kinase [Patescibacteria group bacterium]
MNSHPKHERTLVIIKPDGIQRALIGEVISRYERVGLKLVAMKMVVPTHDMVEAHYTLDKEWKFNVGKKNIKAYIDKGLKPPHEDPMEHAEMILKKLKNYMASGPVIPMVWQGADAVSIVRKITGGTEPLLAAMGTIRGDYVLDSYKIADTDIRAVRNIVHASGSVSEANHEISHWFKDDELVDYRLISDAILYDVDITSTNN